MLYLINVLVRRTVDRLIEIFETSNRTQDIVDDAAQRVAERISDRDLVAKVADRIGGEEVAGHIDVEEVAGHLDIYDVVNNIDMADVASHIDMNELAEHVARNMPEPSPAPAEVPVSDPSLIERLLDKAVQALLERAEEAARKGEL
jgi:hypothetical protein